MQAGIASKTHRNKHSTLTGVGGFRRMSTASRVASYTAVVLAIPLLPVGEAEISTSSEQTDLHESDFTCEGVPGETATENTWSPIRLLELYADALEKKPLLVKCISSGVLGALGDLISQCLFWILIGDAVWHDKEAMLQTLAVALDGLLVSAPIMHCLYGALDQWIPADEATFYAIMQVVIDVFVVDTVYALIFIFTTGFFEGKSVTRDMIPTVKADYLRLVYSLVVLGLVLAPLQVYLFKHVSLKWRVLIGDVMDILWVIIASYIIGPAS